MKMNPILKLIAVTTFTFLSLPLAADANLNQVSSTLESRQPRIAIKTDPFDYFVGSFNAELEVWLTKNISLVLPVFFAHHDAALIKNSLFWNSSLGVNIGAKFHPADALKGFYIGPEAGVFVVYPFESGTRHFFGGNSVYSEVKKSPFALAVGVLRVGYDHIFENGLMLDASAGLIMYEGFPWGFARLQVGWAF